MSDARGITNDARRAQLKADLHQAQIEEEGELVKALYESKNKSVDAILRMLKASQATSAKLMASTMAR